MRLLKIQGWAKVANKEKILTYYKRVSCKLKDGDLLHVTNLTITWPPVHL